MSQQGEMKAKSLLDFHA